MRSSSSLRNKSKMRKAQFFILSAFTIVSIMYIISRWMEPLNIVDTSSAALIDEPFIFNNIVEKVRLIVNTSKSCDDLRLNLDEYKNFVESFLYEKSMIIFQYQEVSPCKLPDGTEIPATINFNITLNSNYASINSKFSETWLPVQ